MDEVCRGVKEKEGVKGSMYCPTLKTNKNGVPYLSKEKIELITENFVADFCPEALKVPMQIDIDAFATFYLGLEQDFKFLSHNGIYLGMMIFNDTNKLIVYEPSTNSAEYFSAKARTVIIDNRLLHEAEEHRYRYTMGHECFHDVFHSGYYAYDPNQSSMFDLKEPMIQCREVVADEKRKPPSQWTPKESMEWQANYAAAAFLMPKPMVTKLVQSLPEISDFFHNNQMIMAVSKTFNVSVQAAKYRLSDLGLLKNSQPTDGILTMDFSNLII